MIKHKEVKCNEATSKEVIMGIIRNEVTYYDEPKCQGRFSGCMCKVGGLL